VTAVWIVLGALGLAVLVIALSHNRFVRQRNLVRDSWSNIDTELRRRHDLVPNLVQTVSGYAAHEREVLAEVTAARTAAVGSMAAGDPSGPAETPGKQVGAENALAGSVRHLLAVAERYPELKADGAFLSLHDELTDTEDRIQAARRFYNANVRDYNQRVESVPSNAIASLFGFRKAEFFEVEPAVRARPSTTAL
jgi:LemA protein